jgi:hypothetical protein
MNNQELNAMVRRHKTALTIAKKKGPEAVIDIVRIAFEDFQEHGWPDNWHIWNIAKEDAEMALRRKGWEPSNYLDY